MSKTRMAIHTGIISIGVAGLGFYAALNLQRGLKAESRAALIRDSTVTANIYEPLPSPTPASTPNNIFTIADGAALPFVNASAPIGPYVISADGKKVFEVAGVDLPVGPCDLGKLVRLGNAHMAQHPIPPINATTLAYHAPCRDFNTDAQCKVYEAEAALKTAKAAAEAQAKRDKEEEEFRAELRHCEPKKEKR